MKLAMAIDGLPIDNGVDGVIELPFRLVVIGFRPPRLLGGRSIRQTDHLVSVPELTHVLGQYLKTLAGPGRVRVRHGHSPFWFVFFSLHSARSAKIISRFSPIMFV